MDVLRLMQVLVGRICEVCEILLESFGLGGVAWKYNKLARLYRLAVIEGRTSKKDLVKDTKL